METNKIKLKMGGTLCFAQSGDLEGRPVFFFHGAPGSRLFHPPEKITIKQIAETVSKVVGNVKIEYTPARPGDFSGKEVSSDLVKKELGWEARTSFEEGVRNYVDWYKKRENKRKSDLERLDKVLKI